MQAAHNQAARDAIAMTKYDGKLVYHAIVIARPDLEIKKWPEDGKGRRISFAISSARFLRAVFSF